jgi:hypothetical protein
MAFIIISLIKKCFLIVQIIPITNNPNDKYEKKLLIKENFRANSILGLSIKDLFISTLYRWFSSMHLPKRWSHKFYKVL